MFRLAVAALLVVCALGQKEIHPDRCAEPGAAELKKLVVTPCDSDPCELKKGTTAQMEFEYVSDQDSETVQIDFRVKVFKMFLPVPGVNPDLCKVIECPVKKGQTYKGVLNIPVPKVPIKKTLLRVKVNGDQGMSACFEYPLTLA